MAHLGFLELAGVALTSGFTSGFTLKLLDIGYEQFVKRSERSRSAKDIVDRHLDPLLKAADEVVGKLRSMAARDFESLRPRRASHSAEGDFTGDLSSLSYLIARFWAQVEILRLESLYVALSRDRRGAQLLGFLDCLESQHGRLVDRATQRAIGEAMILADRRPLECLSFIGFVEKHRADPRFEVWVAPLTRVLKRLHHTTERQRLLQYGAVVHALIDTLDRKHSVTKKRPAFANKLTRRSCRDLRYRVFRVYLDFVKEPEKYYQVERSARPK